jgi:hypothetical protein
MALPVTSITNPDSEVVLTSGIDLVGVSTGATSQLWTKVVGPGTVTFTTPTQLSTHADFSVNGVYLLRLTGTNVSGSMYADIIVTVFSLMAVPNPNPAINSENP